jgi:alpha-galactosidase
MAAGAKIAFLGAASASFGLSMLRDLFATPGLKGATLTLVGRNAARLDRAGALARVLNANSGAGLVVEQTTDRRAALAGADFVVNATAIDRARLWKLDFEVPRKYGIRHTLGENGGPGGLFFTLRTLPMVFDFVRDMEELCPRALFINFSNPESRIIRALGKYSAIRAIGLCHGIFMSRGDVASIMDLPAEEVDVMGAGLNHFQWLLQIRNRKTGRDLYPLLREKEARHDPSALPLTRRLFRAFGYWPTCSDSHLGEYLAYGWEAGEEGYDFDGDERWRVERERRIDRVLGGREKVPDDWLTPSGERGADVISAVLHNRKRFLESGVIYNDGAIPNLPPDIAVEVPVMVDASGIHPVLPGPLPDVLATTLLTEANVQRLAVDAAMHGSKELALQALLIDPVINSADAAAKLLDELWEINRGYIRKCLP